MSAGWPGATTSPSARIPAWADGCRHRWLATEKDGLGVRSVILGQLSQSLGIHGRVGHHGHPARRDRDQRRHAPPTLEAGALPQYGARSVLGQSLSILLHPHHPVEDQKDVTSL